MMITAFSEIGKTQEERNFKEKISPDFNLGHSNLELLERHSSEDELVGGKWAGVGSEAEHQQMVSKARDMKETI